MKSCTKSSLIQTRMKTKQHVGNSSKPSRFIFFDVDVRMKLTRVNFITILIDGTTDRAVKEQEVFYVMFIDPDTYKPTLAYFEVL